MKEENKQKLMEVFMDELHISEKLAETCANAAFVGVQRSLIEMTNRLFKGQNNEQNNENESGCRKG